ncbi:dematin isoform X2 [Candoia aspera]
MDDEVLGYKDLAAIPRDKAILDIERPDLMIYEPHFTYSLLDREPSLSPSSLSPPPSPEVSRNWAEAKSPGSTAQASGRQAGSRSRSGVQHFHHPETNAMEMNIYKKPPIYKQREAAMAPTPEGKRPMEGLIIKSSKFPAAQPPDPSQPAKIETDYWPCPPSLAVVETEWRRQKASKRGEDEDEDSEETKTLRELQEQELSKVASNLGKLILKEEMEKSLPIRRKTRSLPDRTPFHTSLHGGSSKSASLPASGSTLARLQSTEFSPAGSERGSPGLQVSGRLVGERGAGQGPPASNACPPPSAPSLGEAPAPGPRRGRGKQGQARQALEKVPRAGREAPPSPSGQACRASPAGRPAARAHGPRELPPQHVGAKGLPVRGADGDQPRESQTASRSGPNAA